MLPAGGAVGPGEDAAPLAIECSRHLLLPSVAVETGPPPSVDHSSQQLVRGNLTHCRRRNRHRGPRGRAPER